MEGFKQPDGSDFKGFGFKYTPKEWEQEIGKLMAKGRTAVEARAELIAREEDIRNRQIETRQAA